VNTINKPLIKLNVGCGRNILKGWINLDVQNLPGADIVFDLEQCASAGLPFKNDSIDEFLLSHVLEHIRNLLPLMQELYRVAKPGAVCVVRSPFGSSDDAWEDPTHLRSLFVDSFVYFGQPAYWRADYGYRGDWQTERILLVLSKNAFAEKSKEEILFAVRHFRNVVVEMTAVLRAVKPARSSDKTLQTPPAIEIKLI